MKKPFSEDHAHGMLVGLAIGDMLAGPGTHDLPKGHWSDKTTQAMCLAQMQRSANGWDADDVMRRFINWRDHGYLSATGVPFGLSPTVEAAILAYEETGNPYSGTLEPAGADALARVAPLVIAYGSRKESAQAVAQLQARLTHGHALSQRACANMAEFMVTGHRDLLPTPDRPIEVTDEPRSVLHATFWALAHHDSFEATLNAAIGLGRPAHTIGAVTGQLAGRIYGYDAIPDNWRNQLVQHDKILKAADDLYVMRPIDV